VTRCRIVFFERIGDGNGFSVSLEGNAVDADGVGGRSFERARDNAPTILSLGSSLRQFLLLNGVYQWETDSDWVVGDGDERCVLFSVCIVSVRLL
jgi:hypothetical protein